MISKHADADPPWPGVAAWSSEEGTRRAADLFREAYQSEPDGVWSAPGRINLIGEHVDYNGGCCLPVPLPHRTFVALRRRDDDRICLTSAFDGQRSWRGRLSDLAPGQVGGWPAYAAGSAWAFAQEGLPVGGFEAAIDSCVPPGAGLSSSAAVECAVALALDAVNRWGLAGTDAGRARLATACVRAENDVVGAPTGGMDQAAALRSTPGHALLFDASDESIAQIPFRPEAEDLELTVIDTRATHELADGQYGARRAECAAAARALGVASLRQVQDLGEALSGLDDPVLQRRVRHVVSEMERVARCVTYLRAGQLTRIGPEFSSSHRSLRDDFEVSCTELDLVVDTALECGALGARMTGGGFGGCAIALLPREVGPQFAAALLDACAKRGLVTPRGILFSA